MLDHDQRTEVPSRLLFVQPQPDQGNYVICQSFQQLQLFFVQHARTGINDTESSHIYRGREFQRGTRIKADFRFAGYQRVIQKTLILEQIRDNKNLIRHDGVSKEGDISRRCSGIRSRFRLEPLPVIIRQVNPRDRCVADERKRAGNGVKNLFRLRFQNFQMFEQAQALGFIRWKRYGFHEFTCVKFKHLAVLTPGCLSQLDQAIDCKLRITVRCYKPRFIAFINVSRKAANTLRIWGCLYGKRSTGSSAWTAMLLSTSKISRLPSAVSPQSMPR